jgi:Bacterial Ig domain
MYLIKQLMVWGLLGLALQGLQAHAAGVFIPAQQRRDMVYDERYGVVYITNGSELLRYEVSSGTFLSPVALGGSLNGIDLSPDGSTLVVADGVTSGGQVSVYLVSIPELYGLAYTAVRKVSTPLDFYEGGAWSVAFAADGTVRVTTQFLGSGWVPLRSLDPSTGVWKSVASVRQNTMLSSSGDAQTIAFAESNISDGRWGLIDIPTDAIVYRQLYENGTSWFNFEIATDAMGAQFAIPTYGGTMVYDETYRKVKTLGVYAGPQPIGVAYHPVQRIAYFPWAQTREVRVLEMMKFNQITAYDFENDFVHTGNGAYGQGRIRISRDGSLLMVTVAGGVRALRLYSPLEAGSVNLSTWPNSRLSFKLPGKIGNNDTLTYSLVEAPRNGRASIFDGTMTYMPDLSFSGTDTLTYRVHYGLAMREGKITIEVAEPNAAPIATDDSATVGRNPVFIPIMANDRDSNGDILKIVAVDRPRFGDASIQGRTIKFVPSPKMRGTTRFAYAVSDGRGGLARAWVTVRRR